MGVTNYLLTGMILQVHSKNLTWNLKMMVLKMSFLFQRDDFQVLNFGRVSFLFWCGKAIGDELTLRVVSPIPMAGRF